MSNPIKLISFIIVFVILAISAWYVYTKTKPSKTEIDAIAQKSLVVPTDILSDPIVTGSDNFRMNGSLPIDLKSSDKGRNNPFADF